MAPRGRSVSRVHADITRPPAPAPTGPQFTPGLSACRGKLGHFQSSVYSRACLLHEQQGLMITIALRYWKDKKITQKILKNWYEPMVFSTAIVGNHFSWGPKCTLATLTH